MATLASNKGKTRPCDVCGNCWFGQHKKCTGKAVQKYGFPSKDCNCAQCKKSSKVQELMKDVELID